MLQDEQALLTLPYCEELTVAISELSPESSSTTKLALLVLRLMVVCFRLWLNLSCARPDKEDKDAAISRFAKTDKSDVL